MTLETTLRDLIAEELFDDAPDLTVTSDLFEHGLDSMATMQLLILVENRLGVSLPASALTRENLRSVRALAEVIRQNQP